MTLLQPLYDDIQEAINPVAKEGGYDVVFGSGSMLYAGSRAEEISDQVFKKLGVTPPADNR